MDAGVRGTVLDIRAGFFFIYEFAQGWALGHGGMRGVRREERGRDGYNLTPHYAN